MKPWPRRIVGTFLAVLTWTVCVSGGACGGCHEGVCECADGTKLRVESAPCQCGSVCSTRGGVCSDDFAGCPGDAGDAGDAGTGAEVDAWPWPWDASSG